MSISDKASDATLLKVCNIVLPILALTLLTCGWVAIAVGVVLLICEIFFALRYLAFVAWYWYLLHLVCYFLPIIFLIVALIVAVVYK